MELVDDFGIPIAEDFKTSAKRFQDQGASKEEIDAYISDFKEMKPKITDVSLKDIDRWKSFGEFKAFVDGLKELKTRGQEKREKKAAGAKLVAQDKYWDVYEITSHEAACAYGAGTKWCITQPSGEHWKSYTDDGSRFFFYISKRLSKSSPFYKIAMEVRDGDRVYWDSTDRRHDTSSNFMRKDMIGSIPFRLPEIPGEPKRVPSNA